MDAPVYKKLIDIENLQENFYNTLEGQQAVSVTENFWSRAIREGRWRSETSKVSLPSDGVTMGQSGGISCAQGYRFYPKTVILSSNVDAELNLILNTNVAGMTVGNYRAFCKAGTPLVINFDGEMFIEELGTIKVGGITTGTGGFIYGSIIGVEVTPHA